MQRWNASIISLASLANFLVHAFPVFATVDSFPRTERNGEADGEGCRLIVQPVQIVCMQKVRFSAIYQITILQEMYKNPKDKKGKLIFELVFKNDQNVNLSFWDKRRQEIYINWFRLASYVTLQEVDVLLENISCVTIFVAGKDFKLIEKGTQSVTIEIPFCEQFSKT